jgi:hypothetical protein
MLLKWFASQGSCGWRTLSGNKNIQILARMLRGQSIQGGAGGGACSCRPSFAAL